MAIRVEHIIKNYGDQVAVNDVSFTIPTGQCCGFLGPNGAGKSTLMKIMTGFLQPDSGSVFIDDINVGHQPILAKQHLGYLPEQNPLYNTMYVREFLTFCANIFGLSNKTQRINQVIDQTGLGNESHKRIGQLSKGYKQRVGIAQALIHDPAVLILDEPLSGLDPNQLEEIRQLIRTLSEEKTILFSSHILQEVEQVAQRILLLRNGFLVMDSGNNYDSQQQRWIQLEFSEKISQDFLDQLVQFGEYTQSGLSIRLFTTGEKIRKNIFELAKNTGDSLIWLDEQEESLTEVFKSKTAL